MATPIDLTVAKKNLSDSLGDDMKSYLHNLKSWFRQKISKEDFDSEARKLLSSETVHLHNEFLLAIFSKCQSLSSSLIPRSPPTVHSQSGSVRLLKKGKLKRKPPLVRSTFQQRFVPVNPMSCASQASYKSVEDTVFASRELSVPDITMVHGRLLVCAWESGLSTVDDNAVRLVTQAIEVQLKNIISQVLSRRNGYQLREGRFKHAMGTPVPNPYTRHRHLLRDRTINSEATTISEGGHHVPSRRLPDECNAGYRAQLLAAATYPRAEDDCGGGREPVSLYTLLETLQTTKSTIASHSVYAPAVERAIHKLWHPDTPPPQSSPAHTQDPAKKHRLSTSHPHSVR